MEKNESIGKHMVTIEDRKKIKITCVEDVESFNEEKVVVYTKLGVMVIVGYDFKISSLNLDNGGLTIDGEVDKVEYMEIVNESDREGASFFGKLFR